MNKLLIIVLFFVLGSVVIVFADDTVMNIYGFVEDFSWKEQVSHIEVNFVDESGFRYGIGGDVDIFSNGGFGVIFAGEGYLGAVDYKGGIQNSLTGQYVPYNSKTSYYGIRGNFDFGYKFKGNNYLIIPYCGYGFDLWNRVLDADLFETEGKYGYSELWLYTTVRVGARGEYSLNSNVNIFSDLCLNIFPYVSEYIYSNGKDVTLEPEGKIGFDFEVGLSYNDLLFSFFWTERQFDQSDEIDEVYQPASDERRVGVKLGFNF
jgi:hypothetical protein